jgi:hypothetical protein
MDGGIRERHRPAGAGFDLLKWLHSWGVPGLLVSLVLGYGVAFVLAAIVARWLSLRLLTNSIGALPRGDDGRICACEECLYPMSHAPPGEVSRCPERGAEFFKRTTAGGG